MSRPPRIYDSGKKANPLALLLYLLFYLINFIVIIYAGKAQNLQVFLSGALLISPALLGYIIHIYEINKCKLRIACGIFLALDLVVYGLCVVMIFFSELNKEGTIVFDIIGIHKELKYSPTFWAFFGWLITNVTINYFCNYKGQFEE